MKKIIIATTNIVGGLALLFVYVAAFMLAGDVSDNFWVTGLLRSLLVFVGVLIIQSYAYDVKKEGK